MTPEEILLEAEEDIRNGVLPRQSRLKRHLLDYKEHIGMQNLAPLTIKSRMTGIYSFYDKNDITLPSLPNNETKPRPLLRHKEIPTKEDIKSVLNHCDELEKVIVLIGISSGLSAKEISNLTVGDFRKGFDPITGVTTLKLRRAKVNYDFVTFLSPEASKAVLNYLDLRNKVPKVAIQKKVNINAKQRIYDDSNFLLCSRRVPSEYMETKDERLRQLLEASIISIYENLSEAANKITPSGNWGLIRSHNMRKYFNSALLNAGADSFIVDFWMGHALDETKNAYFRASNGLRDIYLKFVPYLTIQKEADVSESPEYLRIKNENQILAAETARHVVERQELQDPREQLEIERADRNEYERNIEGLLEIKMQEKMKQMEAGFNAALDRIEKGLKEKPTDP